MTNDNRPTLALDLGGPDGNVFLVTSYTRACLDGETLKSFNREIGDATLLTSGKRYEDILRIVNSYVLLIDSSGTYRDYAAETLIISAVDRLNEQLATLPETVFASIQGLYPEFGYPDCGPEMYLVLIEEEIASVSQKLEQALGEEREPLERLKAMLEECATALRRAGV